MLFVKGKDSIKMFIEGEPCDHCAPKVMKANTSDGAGEKHVPVATFTDGVLEVKVGSVDHAMTPGHYISWIYVETKDGGMFKYTKDLEKAVATFKVDKEEVVAVYEYCNLHGLWKLDIE